MFLTRRIENWLQTVAVIEFLAGVVLLIAAIVTPSLKGFALAAFAVFLGLRLWTVGCKRAAKSVARE